MELNYIIEQAVFHEKVRDSSHSAPSKSFQADEPKFGPSSMETRLEEMEPGSDFEMCSHKN